MLLKLYIWVIYILIVIVSILPFIRYDLFRSHPKYRHFFWLSLLLFIWSIITGLRFVVIEPAVLYYLSFLIYPLVFGIVSMFLLSIYGYLQIQIPKIVKILLILFFLFDLGAALTNSVHLLILDIPLSNDVTLIDFNIAKSGILFFIHTFTCYAILLVIGVKLISSFYRNMKAQKDYLPFIVLLFCLFTGLGINMIHIFVYTFTLDPTYILFVLFNTSLYFIFYIRDLKVILALNNNRFILDNFREMYLIVDINGNVVDASDEFCRIFSLSFEVPVPYQEVNDVMCQKAIIYKETKELSNQFDPSKIYLHMKERRINLPFFRYSGRFFLFYDETQNQELLYRTNYIMTHDIMTNLYNRNYYESIVETLDRSNLSYGIIIFDLDGLKLHNDYLGHKDGDNLLITFANALLQISKTWSSKPIRFGGDEFLLVFEETTINELKQIITELHKMVFHKDVLKNISFSYGMCIKNDEYDSISKVLKKADEQLYQMKENRRLEKQALINYLEKKF